MEKLSLKIKEQYKFEELPQKLQEKVVVEDQEKQKDREIEEKVELIKKKYKIEYSDEERYGFDEWFENLPKNSFKEPIDIANINEALKLLPIFPNYSDKKVTIFLRKNKFSIDELLFLLENFSKNNPSFEIAIIKYLDELISIEVGDKTSNKITLDGKYFGHYHPSNFGFENSEILPDCFNKGLLPSSGDLNGFFEHVGSIKDGTRIFSKYGYVFIEPLEAPKDLSVKLKEFRSKYFDLFLGDNKLNLKSDKEIIEYFKENFGLKIQFNYLSE